MLLQSQPTNGAVRGWLYLGHSQDSKRRRVVLGWAVLGMLTQEGMEGAWIGRKIDKEQSLTAEL